MQRIKVVHIRVIPREGYPTHWFVRFIYSNGMILELEILWPNGYQNIFLFLFYELILTK